MKKIPQTIVPEICFVLAIFGVPMLRPGNVIGLLALTIVTFSLIFLLLRINKRRRNAAARARMIELVDAFTQLENHHSRY